LLDPTGAVRLEEGLRGGSAACTLSKKVAAAAPGTRVKLGVFRQGNEETVQVTLGELPRKGPDADGR
jgi:hypothetical protein